MAGPIEKPTISMGNGKRATTWVREACYEVDPSAIKLRDKSVAYLVLVTEIQSSIQLTMSRSGDRFWLCALRLAAGGVLEVAHCPTADSGRRLYCCDDKVEKHARLRGKVMT
jgi:hypothetical protein